MRQLLLWLALLAGCGERNEIVLHYEVVGISLKDLVRVETLVSVAPSDPREFFTDQPFRMAATGVGYEVRDFDQSGHRKMLITHDASLGFVFADKWIFTLLPPSGESPPPLVINVRAVGVTDTVGRSPPVPARFAKGGSALVKLTDGRCGAKVCGSDQACCNGSCAAINTDASNCGQCGLACGPSGDSCSGAACRCAGGSACTGNKKCCALVGCVDLDTDPFNCGACGTECDPGESCSGGKCTCNGGADCGPGGLCCAATGCSSTGSCPCGIKSCASPNVCCNAATALCVDLKSNNADCGSCGTSCAAPLACVNGACSCKGQICSPGDQCCSAGCANLQNDNANCGSCGHACATNEICVAGSCTCGGAAQCTSTQLCCGGKCVNPTGDFSNCGACDHSCNGLEQCVNSQCFCPGTNPTRACGAGETCCPPSGPSMGGCFDLSASHDNCGACGHACNGNEQCINRACVASSCSSCNNGNQCVSGSCQCNAGPACSGAQFCCTPDVSKAPGCTDRLLDPNNCGTCGHVCGPDQLCCNGNCIAHTASNCARCADVCTSTAQCCLSGTGYACVPHDTKNCRLCGDVCSPTLKGACCCAISGGWTCSTVLQCFSATCTM
jgi:hypothetical protein